VRCPASGPRSDGRRQRWRAGDRRHFHPATPFRLADLSGGLEPSPVALVNEVDDSMLPAEFGVRHRRR
jgi:hypothetical protein